MAAVLPKEEFFLKKNTVSFFVAVILTISSIFYPIKSLAIPNNTSANINNKITYSNPTLKTNGNLFDDSQSTRGLLIVNYKSSSNKGLKISIEKGNDKYIYNLNGNGKPEYFPLQLGSGEYSLKIFENTAGNKYKVVKKSVIKVEIVDSLTVYTNSVININWDESMNAVKKAREITAGLTDDKEKIRAIYSYVVNNISYDYSKLEKIESNYLPTIDNTLKEGKGICYDYSSLFAAMLRSVGIPSKLVKGYTKNAVGYHAWNEVYIKEQNKWVVIDTTYDSQLKKSNYKTDIYKDSKLYNKVGEY